MVVVRGSSRGHRGAVEHPLPRMNPAAGPSRRAHKHLRQSRQLVKVAKISPDTATTEPSEQQAAEPQPSEPQLDWRKNWYPVRPVTDLPTDRPVADKLLGQDIVIWRDGEGEWRAFVDRCPHRRVALSEGRIEPDGTLSCAYHGWRFNGAGNCITIPQLYGDDDYVSRILARPAACATAFPTAVHDDCLFVWMDAQPGAFEEAAATPIQKPEEGSSVAIGPWTARDMEMCVEVLLENLLDPSHVSFSHHGIMGNREQPDKSPMDNIDRDGLIGFTAHRKPSKRGSGSSVYCAPSLAKVKAEFPGFDLQLFFYITPLTRMTSRLVSRSYSSRPLPFFLSVLPTWWNHVRSNAVLDGDAVFLNRQTAEFVAAGCPRNVSRRYYMPASCDVAVAELWKLLARHNPGGVNYYDHVVDTTPAPRRQVLDRYTQHTKDCHACKAVLRNLRGGYWVASVLGVVGAAVTAAQALLARPIVPGTTVRVAMLAACFVAVAALHWASKRFMFVDYVHAERA